MKFLRTAAVGLLALLSVTIFILPEVSAAVPDLTEGVDVTSTTFVFVCTLLVFVMIPGIALFYGGMLRKQSMTSMIAQCLGVVGVAGIVWVAVGYSLAFGEAGPFSIVGDLDSILISNVSMNAGDGIPDIEFLLFQGMFAILTACIVYGATAERVRYPAILSFILLWSVFVYAPMAHMVWGGGLLSAGMEELGLATLDFAGGTVVHICSGITGVAAALALGRRSGRVSKGKPHNIPIMFIGCVLLWVGWFGFNCGSELAVDGTTMLVFFNTFIASVVSTFVWMVIQYVHVGRVSASGLCSGVLAGLVGITPGCAYVEPWAAVVIGALASVLCYAGIIFMRSRKDIDDALDVMGVHGIGGIWGSVAVGIFAVAEYGGVGGLIEGEAALFGGQVLAVVITLVYCFVISFVIMKVIDYVMRHVGSRSGAALTEDEQAIGSDIIEHGEPSYDY